MTAPDEQQQEGIAVPLEDVHQAVLQQLDHQLQQNRLQGGRIFQLERTVAQLVEHGTNLEAQVAELQQNRAARRAKPPAPVDATPAPQKATRKRPRT